MPCLRVARSIRAVLCAALLVGLHLDATAQLQAGTDCGANAETVPGPRTSTTSQCQEHRAFADPQDPSVPHEGTGTASSRVSVGVLGARATATADGGQASAFSFAEVNSSLSVRSRDESRMGEEVFVTFGAHQLDATLRREPVAPRQDGGIAFDYSFAATRLTYEFDMFTLLSGSTLQWAWTDTGVERIGVDSENDLSSHETTGEFAPRVVRMLLGEGASFRLTLTASAEVQGSGFASIDADPAAYWGGITSVVDAAGRPVDYIVAGGDFDWKRSYVPGLAAPVPEPAAWLMVAAGGLMVAASKRRRAAKPPAPTPTPPRPDLPRSSP